MKVAVLGCGPSGLLAAHAAVLGGHQVAIYSRKVKSEIHGAQYIHEEIPDVTGSPNVISYAKLGTSTGYAEKVYGSPLAPSSWASFPQGDYPAWPMGAVYDRLWIAHERRILDGSIGPADLRSLTGPDGFDLVFNSIPARSLCVASHTFRVAEVAFEPTCYVDLDNVVVYSGRETEPWYRTSNLFGHEWTEYGMYAGTVVETMAGWVRGIKPIETDCDCHTHPKLVRVGRFGKWEKKVLVTDAFKDAKEALDEV